MLAIAHSSGLGLLEVAEVLEVPGSCRQDKETADTSDFTSWPLKSLITACVMSSIPLQTDDR